MRIAASVEYDGHFYCGWQKQTDVKTIQAAIETALSDISQSNISISAAGRTDAGVHALGQIIHFDTDVIRSNNAWVKGVNSLLPKSIRIRWAQETAPDFHSRHSATLREYQYLIINDAVSPALLNEYAGWIFYSLNFSSIQKACMKFLGQHDFSSFRSSECQAENPIREIHYFDVKQYNNTYIFTMRANGFLHHQIRNMMGAIILVGRDVKPVDFIDFLLAQKDRTLAPPTFMPNGLYLTNIKYDAKWGLPESDNKLKFLGY